MALQTSVPSRILFTLLAVAAVGCGEPDNVAGSYTIAITNGANGCNIANWTEGDTSQGIPVTITQDGESATAVVEGLPSIGLALLFGSSSFQGEVSGSSLDLNLYGSNSFSEGNCTYTYNGRIEAELTGDILTGEIRYRAATVDNPDCAPIEGCVSIQRFNGTRPPTAQ